MSNKKKILQVAATYIGTVVGAGFATGKEIVEFFISSGVAGLLGILFTGLGFIWIGTKIMRLSSQYGFDSYQAFNDYLFGKKFGLFINSLFLVILFGTTSVMIAGTGSLFQEQLGIAKIWGILFIVLFCFLAMLKGLQGILTVNSIIVPIMIGFTLLIAYLTLGNPTLSHWSFPFPELWSDSRWFINALVYVSYNVTMAIVVLAPLGNEINDERILKWGGFIGGLGLTVILLSSFIVLGTLPHVKTFNIPMAQAIKAYGPLIHYVYVAVVFGEIFSTVIGNVFGLGRQLQNWLHLSQNKIVILILLICVCIGLGDFGTLLAFFYRLFGTIGLFILFFIIFFPVFTLRSQKRLK
ncbi:membrane protein [Pullulanibacillus camelliae]|uniref:Membrane protein n=1 Tax=Pullulanibacillus camelliae TaxID=1707096 RepID=A0A8J2YMH2_9BACL|nr:hypothetical protein [Pullulanibacillus camelliae]GGE52605.1 membrane protein [Pullulanibacillus camelliae]